MAKNDGNINLILSNYDFWISLFKVEKINKLHETLDIIICNVIGFVSIIFPNQIMINLFKLF